MNKELLLTFAIFAILTIGPAGNQPHWRDVGRGLFLYAANRKGLADDLLFPKALAAYCRAHAPLCTQAGFPRPIYLPIVMARWPGL